MAGAAKESIGRRNDGARDHKFVARNLCGLERRVAILVSAYNPNIRIPLHKDMSGPSPILRITTDKYDPKLIVHEDEHLLIVNKPAGWNTHSPAPFAGEGIYEWLKNREPRWAKLAIIHRLDKETSGLLLFSKTTEANRSLTRQFAEGAVQKEYVLQTEGRVPKKRFTIRSHLKRVGERYASVKGGVSGQDAETEFEIDGQGTHVTTLIARPRTGRTHQIRVHAAENGFPICGDTLYGGPPADRLWLHSGLLAFKHPATGKGVK